MNKLRESLRNNNYRLGINQLSDVVNQLADEIDQINVNLGSVSKYLSKILGE